MKSIKKIEWNIPDPELCCYACSQTAKNEVQVSLGGFTVFLPLCDRCSGLDEWQLIKALETEGKKGGR